MSSEEEKVWIPSYETRGIDEPESKPMSFGETIVLGTRYMI